MKQFFARQTVSIDTNPSIISDSYASRWDTLTLREKMLIMLTVLNAVLFGGLLGGLVSMLTIYPPSCT